ncbi:MAG TPA: hypothetical protein VN921_02395, partial [Chthoniobacterales bacterium]|nr:hypothetical protein [Chthoniobacterales bacterium]
LVNPETPAPTTAIVFVTREVSEPVLSLPTKKRRSRERGGAPLAVIPSEVEGPRRSTLDFARDDRNSEKACAREPEHLFYAANEKANRHIAEGS